MGGVKLKNWKTPLRLKVVSLEGKHGVATRVFKPHNWQDVKKVDGVAKCSKCKVTRFKVGNQTFYSKNGQLLKDVDHKFC